MSSSKESNNMLVVKSSRFGDLSVAAESVIDFPSGLIGFPKHTRFVMLEHKPPFAWLHSVDDENLAFVVIDGARLVNNFDFKVPFGDKDTDLKEDDDFAILTVVTVRPDPKLTTANCKAPLFVNIRNRKGVQVIYDDPKFPTRFSLWEEQKAAEEESGSSAADAASPEKQK